LIVNADPFSKTSPVPILNRWKDRINVTVWNDEDVYPNGAPNGRNSFNRYIRRQQDFYRKCALTVKAEGRGWTLFTDVDEYTLINPRARNTSDRMYNFAHENLTIPSQAEPGSVMSLLQRAFSTNNAASAYVHANPCVAITRKNFGTRETINPPNTTKHQVWNASHFQTHRWRYHSRGNPIGKALVDLSRVNTTVIAQSQMNAHRAINDVCSKAGAWNSDNAFILYHFSGTLEQVLFRSNDNRNKEGNGTAYRIERYHKDKENDHEMSPVVIEEWLDAFVEAIGLQEAQRLLEHVGKPYQAANLEHPSLV
jgi:hypothetical protein